MRIIPAIARLDVLMWVEQLSAQETFALTVGRDPDVVPSADNVGKVLAGASKLLRRDSARTSNPNNVAYKVTFQCNGLVTTFACSRQRQDRGRGRGGEKLSPFPFLRQPGKCTFA